MFTILVFATLAITAIAAKQVSTSDKCQQLQPFQVVAVDAETGSLFVPKTAQSLLDTCFGVDFHVVSVSGPFHSGKSFMLNALVNSSHSQFEVGRTTESTTRGLWIHGTPIKRDNLQYPIVFMDTEGLAATENTDLHDAKIYSISTLVSAHQLFNTIRNIDTHSVEALELLARRARLFQLKSGLTELESRENSFSFLNTEEGALLQFPSLTWVVQNFFQKQLNGETPTKWLHRLLRAVVTTQQISSASITDGAGSGPLLLDHPDNSADGSNKLSSERGLTASRQKSTLRNIFSPMEAVTMQIPSYDRKDLAELHNVDMKRLSTEYMRDLNQLWSKIEDSLSKKKVRKQISGSTLLSFLNVLVQSSNSKNLQQFPSMWQAHIDRTKTDARDAVGSIFTQRSAKYQLSVPLPMKTFTSDMSRIAKAAKKNVNELLFGLSTPTIETTKTMINGHIAKLQAATQGRNLQQIRTYVDGIRKKHSSKGVADIAKMKIPTATTSMEKDGYAIHSEVAARFQKDIVVYDQKHTTPFSDQLSKSFENALRKRIEENTKEMQKILKRGRQDGTRAFEKMFNDADFPSQKCYIPKQFLKLKKDAVQAAVLSFDAATELCKTEKYYSKENQNAVDSFKNTLDAKYLAMNEKCIKKQLESYQSVAEKQFRGKSRELEASFPIFDEKTLIKTVHAANVKSTLDMFQSSAGRFSYHKQFQSKVTLLKKNARKELEDLIRRNTREITKSVAPIISDIEDSQWIKMKCTLGAFDAGSCVKEFQTLVSKEVHRLLKREWANDRVKMKHVPKVVAHLFSTSFRKKLQKRQEQDAARKNTFNMTVVGVVLALAGIIYTVVSRRE